ncbi:Fe(3+)-hydroxamate ABC transporter permease FhuB [Castellaniella defragrans]|uniref:Iron complex transport system permease protein n=1 Tax=Castellaniella defragrans TaxID=75697 RepID=A0A7W9TNF5_CASDE|nr:Fe(3+)-hydroxamate ABC transporter permease FhuB [Castellaniella defragrans]KAB0623570.1 Fe(3+)-hydroxamate ABC transporter permease FhuB [Castellaniella defragrans]MBB6083940.1 iron complex transport system permease protein [Castellaniella defragrans]
MAPSSWSTTRPAVRWTALAALGVALLLLSAHTLSLTAPASSWPSILAGRPPDPVSGLIFGQAALPRLVIGWLLGAALGLAGVLFQQALRNPLADPAMIGVSSGAYLALAAAVLYAPGLLAWGMEAVALAGGAAACALVMIVAWRSRFSVIHVILAGLIVSPLCGAAGAVLALIHHESLSGLFIWQSGSLVQNGWQGVRRLAPQLAVLAVCVVSLRRPLTMLSLDDARAMSLGVRVPATRFAAMALGVVLSAVTVAGAGVLGFIGLMAPNLGRMLGARTFGQNLAAAPLIGALLLWAADQAVQLAGPAAGQVPTGSACALVGAPLLLWLLLRRRIVSADRPASEGSVVLRHRPASRRLVALFALACLACAAVALLLGRTPQGWAWAWGDGWPVARDWRLPRVMAAGVAGALLSMAGSLLQRLTGNALASPEVLGVSTGASLGVVGMLLLANSLHPAGLLAASGLGALISLIAILALNWHSGFAPQRLLLAGVALSTLFTACAAYLLSSGDPRAFMLLTWMSGSTYHATMAAVWPGVFLLAASLFPAVAARRWLAILPLAEPSARSLGVRVAAARSYFLMIVAVATAGATMLVGPLTFAGLLAPHLVRGLGLRRPGLDLAGSALAGAALMILADWVGRVAAFPWQVPAGLVAMMIGGPFFLWLLWRRNDCA